MSGESFKPDVVVVGMPSCGKTVFLTVLGKKFTNLVGGRRVAPLGFRMSTCDRETATVVNVAYDRLSRGMWPEATKAGQIMPLRWEVFTGRRRIFELFSMDIAGETFRRAFGDVDDAGGGGGGGKNQGKAGKTKDADAGDELYRGDSADDRPADSPMTGDVPMTDEEQAVDRLKNAIATAKVVCFMVNVALPDRHGGKTLDDAGEKKLLRFREAVTNMYLALRDKPDLCGKSMIVLSQTHLHEGEIERIGGPVMYLGEVCGGEAAELSNLARERDIPVMAVSAINEKRDANDLPAFGSPGEIPSSGLFGFLLMVSGMSARGDGIAKVMDAYLAYRRERVEYLKSPDQCVIARLRQARRLHKASMEYVDACMGYLDDTDNLVEKRGGASLGAGDMRMYRLCTKEDQEIKSATGTEYLVRDESWDCVLRGVAASERLGRPVPGSDAIYHEVLQRMLGAFPGNDGNAANEEFVYGFGEDESLYGSGPSAYARWMTASLDEYRESLAGDVADLARLHGEAANSVVSLSDHAGGSTFGYALACAKKVIDLLREKIDQFKREWPGLDIAELLDAENALDGFAGQIADAERENQRALEEAENERRRKEVADGVKAMNESLSSIEGKMSSLWGFVGSDSFASHASSLEADLSRVVSRMDSCRRKWTADYKMQVRELADIKGKCNAVKASIATARQDHRNALAAAEERRRQAERAAARRRRMVAAAVVCLLAGVVYAIGNYGYSQDNERSFAQIKSLYGRRDFNGARVAYMGMHETPLFQVSRSKYFSPGFDERLSVAAEIDAWFMLVNKRARELSEWSASHDVGNDQTDYSQSIARVMEEASREYGACTGLLASVSFDAVRFGTVDVKHALDVATSCETMLVKARASVDNAFQNVQASRMCADVERGLSEVEAKLSAGDAEQAVESLTAVAEKANGISLPEGCDEAIKQRLDELLGKVKKLDEGDARIKAARVGILVKEAKGHFDAGKWEECIKASDKALAMDPANEKAKKLKADAEANVAAEAEAKAKAEAEAKARAEAEAKAKAEAMALEAAETAKREAYDAKAKAKVEDAAKWAETTWRSAESLLTSAESALCLTDYVQASNCFMRAKNEFDIAADAARRERSKNWPAEGREFMINRHSLYMTLKWCDAGTFTMGSPVTEEGRDDDERQHQVTLTRGFWMGETEVTQWQWKKIMNDETVVDLARKGLEDDTLYNLHTGRMKLRDYWGMSSFDDPADRCGDLNDVIPVYNVSWNEAVKFCRKLTALERAEGRIPDGYEYRLPTEAEWEYACRAGTDTALPNGKDIRVLGENDAPALDDIAWYGGNSSAGFEGRGVDTSSWIEKQYVGGRAFAREVKRKRPNKWGLHDMIGNVWEWCGDWSGAYPPRTVIDPTGAEQGEYRVVRGGGWGSGASDCRSAYRDHNEPGMRDRGLGFRVVLAPKLLAK